MKTNPQSEAPTHSSFREQYASLLRQYVACKTELLLGQVYELGRRAIAEHKSLMDLATMHHQAVLELMAEKPASQDCEQLLRASSEFLAECLSPYEMAHRGFQDAVKALRQLNEMLEEEIKRIAYAVHDEAGQLLVAVHLALAAMAPELSAPQQAQLKHVDDLLQEAEKHLRRYSHELRPTILDDLGWIPAIRFLAEGASKRASLPVHFDVMFSERLPSTLETAAYRIVQEALNNTVKHAKAKNVWIRTWREKKTVHCSIRDDGQGFDPQVLRINGGGKGLGFLAMQERASAIGGTLLIESRPGHGTELSLLLPLEEDDANKRSASRRS